MLFSRVALDFASPDILFNLGDTAVASFGEGA